MKPSPYNPKALVVQHNNLIRALYNYGINEMRVLSLALSKLDSRKSPIETPIRIYTSELIEIFGNHLDTHNAYPILLNAIKKLRGVGVRIPSDDLDEGYQASVPWFGKIVELKDFKKASADKQKNSYVEVHFDKALEPFLYDLSSNFTTQKLGYIANLTTFYAMRIYSLLCEAENLEKHRSNLHDGFVLEFELSHLKLILGAEKKYSTWKDFNRWILKPSQEQINRHTHLNLELKGFRKAGGKTFTHVRFDFISLDIDDSGEHKRLVAPDRPRLSKRPSVINDSHEHGQWARSNITKLETYRNELRKFDDTLDLKIEDMRRLVDYFAIIGDSESRDKYQGLVDLRAKPQLVAKSQETELTLEQQKAIEQFASVMPHLSTDKLREMVLNS